MLWQWHLQHLFFFKKTPPVVNYIQDNMRDHLYRILETDQLINFPSTIKNNESLNSILGRDNDCISLMSVLTDFECHDFHENVRNLKADLHLKISHLNVDSTIEWRITGLPN